jgi:DNA-binding CsgD family transcriptional regulator
MSVSVVSPIFIGRQEELASLSALIERVRAGTPTFALVGGEAGVGKTRLLSELMAGASRAGFLVLVGQCMELGAEGLPLAPLVDALRELVRAVPPEELASVLGPAATGLAPLLPELAPDATTRPPAASMQAAQLLELVLGLLTRLSAARPVAFLIEDLHWADRSTLDLVAFLVRTLRAAPVLLVATYRSDELQRLHPLRSLLTGWERVRTVEHIGLSRFTRGEVGAQLAAILGGAPAPGAADQVFDRSGGNAYLVEELAGVVRSEGDPADLPPSLRDVLLSRVDALSPAALRLLRITSVAGRTVSDRLLAHVAGSGETELFAALRELVDTHLLVVDPGGYGYAFRHALTRDAVYEDMLPGERVRLHAAYGAALASDAELVDAAAVPAALAHHWYAALDLPRALPAAIDAAAHATASYAPAEALRHLERALEIWPRVADAQRRTGLDRVEVSRLAAEAAYRCGAVGRSQALFTDALAELPDRDDKVRRAVLLERYAQAQRDSGRPVEAAASLEQALGLLEADQDTRVHAVVLAAMANLHFRIHGGDVQEAAELAGRAVAAARAAGAADAEADAMITLGNALSYLGHAEAGLDQLRSGVRLARGLDIPAIALRASINLSDALELLGRHEEAARAAAEGLDLAARVGLSRTLGCYLTGNQAEPLLRLGQWAEVDRLTAEALNTGPEGVFAATLFQLRAELAAMSGRLDDAASQLRAARRAMGSSTDAQFTQPLRYTEALIALGSADLPAARSAAAAGLTCGTLAWGARYSWPLLWLAMRVEADESVRSRDRREQVPAESGCRRAEITQIAADLAAPVPSSRGYRALVAAENTRVGGTGEPEAWSAAVTVWRDAGEPYPLAYSLLRLAEAYCMTGRRQDAVTPVLQARLIAERIGAAPILDEAAALARRARLDQPPGTAAEKAAASAPRPGPAPGDELARFGLTEREREVLLLVAAGRSNPEIAQALFISAKTASVHVSNILAKLGASSRVEAAAMAYRLGVGQ